MNTITLRCQVLPGIFETEYYVLVNGSSAYYVSRDNVSVSTQPTSNNAVDGKVLGYLVADQGDKVLVQLPGEAVVGSLRTWVDRAALSA